VGARRETREALAAAGLRPRKRWGQHFLCDPAVARRIVDTAEVRAQSTVLEIGPGLGALTDELARRAGRLYLVEIDPGLAARLADRHAGNPRVTVVAGDVLALPLGELVAEPTATVVANLPYNVASPILFRLLDLRARFPRAVVMLQREMAERLVAPPGTAAYGGPSVVMQAMAEVRLAFRVSPRSFVPPPRVQSAVVDVRWAERPRIPLGDEALFRAVVRAAFGQRRKMLRNALAALAAEHRCAVEDVLATAGVDSRTRAERLDAAAFGRLACALAGDARR
jgi:16S rRNA (adenine1518-N6/adenine1519-N6)-dimethyltransferase